VFVADRWGRFRSSGKFSVAPSPTALTTEPDQHSSYRLSATPSFDIPEFLLKRLLKRDASQMIRRLQAEIVARSRRVASPR
jgi:hypothetical protein